MGKTQVGAAFLTIIKTRPRRTYKPRSGHTLFGARDRHDNGGGQRLRARRIFDEGSIPDGSAQSPNTGCIADHRQTN